MKSRFIVIAMGLSLAISAARGNQTLNITEFPAKPSFNFDNLVATFNGAPASFVTITLTSTSNGEEGWTIVLAPGWTLDLPGGLSFDVEIGEPERGVGLHGFPIENFITFGVGGDDRTILFTSEHENFGIGGLPLFDVEHGVLLHSGQRFDIRVADVPEPSSTITLFGIGLAGVASLVRFRRRAV
jgi:hypothetical protein